jgi:type VI secretion system secreted protein VgrG
MVPGAKFKLTHPRPDQNGEYLIVEARYRLEMDAGGEDDRGVFRCRFKAIPARHTFRSPAWTPVPRIGLQTATVVAPRGDPYAADKHGRIKVQFHWETFDPSGADPSQRAWVRAAQGWAGRNWGTMFLPRAGDEVVVAFLDGDPDHPIVIGSLYNNANAAPFALPEYGAISTLCTRSLGGSAGERNELRFNDKDMQVLVYTDGRNDNYVKKDQFTLVGQNAHVIVNGEQRVRVEEQHLTVSGDQNSNVGKNSWMKVSEDMVRHAGKSVLIKGDVSVVLESDVGISLKCGESFVALSPAGLRISSPLTQIDGELVRVTGELVELNCAGGGGMSAGQSPRGPAAAPKTPDEADDGSKFVKSS